MIVIPDLYEPDKNSPFFVSNHALKTTWNRLQTFYVQHHLLKGGPLIPPTSYRFLSTTAIEVAQHHCDSRWKLYGQKLIQVNLVEEAMVSAEIIRDVSISERKSTAISNHFLHFMEKVPLAENPTLLPFLTIQEPYDSSASALKKSFRLEAWLEQIITLFEWLTEKRFFVEQITFASFLYDREGNMRYFIDFHKVKYTQQSRAIVEEHNLRELTKTINTMRIWAEVYEQTNDTNFFSEHAMFNALATMEREYAHQLISFTDFKQFIAGQYKMNQTERIGVFVDLAHLYVGLETYYVNFDLLLTQLLGDKKRAITDKYSAQFIPNYHDTRKNARVEKWLAHFREQLEKYGFTVRTVSNDTAKAKRIINGEEHDVDDQYLIDLMKQMRGHFSEIVVVTGDQHFMQELILQENAGTKVHLVSGYPIDTSQLMQARFKAHHHYIDEFIECIYIR